MKKNKTTAAHINAAIAGYVRAGSTIRQVVKLLGVSALDVEAVVIEMKLSVNPQPEQSWKVYPEYTKALLDSVINTFHGLYGHYPSFMK